MTTRIRPATPDDVAAVMRLERGEGFAAFVGRWSAGQHGAEMAVPGSRYLVAAEEGGLAGFVLLQGLDDPHGCATLRRIAVARPGEGLGSALVAAAQEAAFGEAAVHRLQLRVYPENARARRAYLGAGFIEEGLMRDVSRQADGTYRSMILMAVLRPDWTARRGAPERR